MIVLLACEIHSGYLSLRLLVPDSRQEPPVADGGSFFIL